MRYKTGDTLFTATMVPETGRYEPTIKVKRKLAPLFKEHGIEVE